MCASWTEGTNNSKDDTFLPLVQFRGLDFIVWGTFIQCYSWQRVTNLKFCSIDFNLCSSLPIHIVTVIITLSTE